jgi:hypothetical protein
MTTDELIELHHEGHHRCVVHGGPAPDLTVTCDSCGAPLEAELLSPCEGGRASSRLLLMLRCPQCRSTGQLRLARPAAWQELPPAPASSLSQVEVRPGGAGYVGLRCSCGGAGTLFTLTHTTTPTTLTIKGLVEGCGHAVALRLPRNSAFKVAPHRHA